MHVDVYSSTYSYAHVDIAVNPLMLQVIDRVLAHAPPGLENKEDFLKRLRATAKSLPARYIEKLIESIPSRIQSVLDAKGFTPKKD